MMRSGWTRSKHWKRPRKTTRVSESSETVEKVTSAWKRRWSEQHSSLIMPTFVIL